MKVNLPLDVSAVDACAFASSISVAPTAVAGDPVEVGPFIAASRADLVRFDQGFKAHRASLWPGRGAASAQKISAIQWRLSPIYFVCIG